MNNRILERLFSCKSFCILHTCRRHFNDRRNGQLLGYIWLICDFAHADGSDAPVSYSQAVQYLIMAGFSKSTAYDAVNDLRKAGLLCPSI